MDTSSSNELKYLTLSKKTVIAYILLLCSGLLGAHNFYIGRYGLAWSELGLFLGAMILGNIGGAGIGGVMLIALVPCLIYDLFVLGIEVKKYNIRLKAKLNKEVK